MWVSNMRDNQNRIFCQWADGSYVTTLDWEFHTVLQEWVKEKGPPITIEFRASDDGWTSYSDQDADTVIEPRVSPDDATEEM